MTKSQKYSDMVFKNIEPLVQQKSKDELKKYKTLCKKAGGLLRTVGLMQFMVFVKAKGEKAAEVHHRYLLEHLFKELKQQKILPKIQNTDDMIETIRNQELPAYMDTTLQTLAILQWHKRIADILIQGE